MIFVVHVCMFYTLSIVLTRTNGDIFYQFV